jgi:hypothetical protein
METLILLAVVAVVVAWAYAPGDRIGMWIRGTLPPVPIGNLKVCLPSASIRG